MQSPAELGHAVTADRILPVDPKRTVLVGIERHRLAVTLQIGSGRRKIVEGALALDKQQMHQPAGGGGHLSEDGGVAARVPRTTSAPIRRSGSTRPRNRGDTSAGEQASTGRGDPSTGQPSSSIAGVSRRKDKSRAAPRASPPPASGQSPGSAP